jgi:hypothetical protein
LRELVVSCQVAEAVGRLPAEIELGPIVGRGRRSTVYRARLHGREVAVKLYRPEATAKYQRRCGPTAARFEYQRNLAFHRVGALRPFVAEPLRAVGEDDECCDAFVQEFIEGRTVREVAQEQGGIPLETLAALKNFVELAGSAGLFDIDISPTNMKLRHNAGGWLPVLFDFNLIPQHRHAPNPWVWLLYRTGLRHPAHRDRLMLEKLQTWKG